MRAESAECLLKEVLVTRGLATSSQYHPDLHLGLKGPLYKYLVPVTSSTARTVPTSISVPEKEMATSTPILQIVPPMSHVSSVAQKGIIPTAVPTGIMQCSAPMRQGQTLGKDVEILEETPHRGIPQLQIGDV